MAYRDLVEELHERLRDGGWRDVRPAFGFVLLAARDTGTTATDLAVLMGTTKQAASKLVAAMVAAGYVDLRTGDDDGRRRPLHLTERGTALLAAVESIYADLEAEWATAIGASGVARLRRDVTKAVAARHGGELPPVRPTW
jgi:DNA-binding MarR family transcriptional regulator